MKINGDDQEQIGISAIDLFASGMGAFILIAIIFMVLFAAASKQVETAQVEVCPEPVVLECPEVEECPPAIVCPDVEVPACPECPSVVETACPECPPVAEVAIPQCPPTPVLECPESLDCPICPICEEATPLEPIPPTAPESEPIICPEPAELATILPETDIVFVLDTTRSMTFEIEAVKRELYVVVDVLERMMPSVAIGVVTFKDRFQRPPIRHHPVRTLTNDPENLNDLQRFLRTISIHNASGSNPDTPEAVLLALQQAVNTSFRRNINNRVIIVITDSFAYPHEQSATFQLAREFAQTEGHRITSVFVRTHTESEQYLQQLADAGNGILVYDRGSILANVLLSLLPER